MTKHSTSPRIYVAVLADYNNGVHTGEWIDAVDADDMREEIARILRTSKYPNVTVDCLECDGKGERDIIGGVEPCPYCKQTGKVPSAEEYAIHDHEGFGGYKVGEYEGIDTLAELGAAIEEHGDIIAKYAEHVGGDVSIAISNFPDAYRGEFQSLAEYAGSIVDDCYNDVISKLPDFIRHHLDYEGMGNDMKLSGDIFTIEDCGSIHVFDNNV